MPIAKSASNARLATMEGETNFNVSWLSGNYTWPTYIVLLVLFRVLEFYFFTPVIPAAVQWTIFHTAHGIVSGEQESGAACAAPSSRSLAPRALALGPRRFTASPPPPSPTSCCRAVHVDWVPLEPWVTRVG